MKILIDCQTFHTHERYRGIGRYLIECLRRMIAEAPEKVYFGAVLKDLPLSWLPPEIKEKIKFVRIPADLDSADPDLQTLQYSQGLEDLTEAEQIDVYWNPNPLMPNVLFPGKLRRCATVSTIHDLIPLNFPAEYLDALPKKALEDYFSRLEALRLQDHLLAVSNATKNDLVGFTQASSEKITVVYEGVGKGFFAEPEPSDFQEVGLRYGLPEHFVFTVGGPNYRKNNTRLLEAFAEVADKSGRNIHLVFGSEFDSRTMDEMKAHAEKAGVGGRVMFTGAIAEGDLPVVFRMAELFVFPSLYEGFGLPVLEAMASGAPVAAARNSSIPEVAGDCAVYFDPYDISDMAEKMLDLLSDRTACRAMAEKGRERAAEFSWDKAARNTLSLFARALSGADKKPAAVSVSVSSRIKLAFFSPLNPQQSGISDYSEELLPHLAEYADIDLFVDGIKPANPAIAGRFGCYDYTEFEKIAAVKGYDNILYHMGNNTLHEYIYRMLRKYSGVTVLHDCNIHSFIRNITLVRGCHEEYLSEIEDSYGTLGSFISSAVKRWDYDLDCHGFAMNQAVFRESRAVITHNEWSKNRSGSDNVFVIPIGAELEEAAREDETAGLRRKFGIGSDVFVAACFGDIVHTKRIEPVLRAYSIFRLFHPDSLLVLAGRLYPDMEPLLNKLIARYGLDRGIRMTGRIELEDFKQYMKASDVVLNLRYPTLGESSASHLRAMSFGKPVIVSNVRQFREFPDDCCLKVDVGGREQDQLLDRLMKLRKDEKFRRTIGENAWKYVRDNCSWEKTAREYAGILFATARKSGS